MIDFKPLDLSQKPLFDRVLQHLPERGCEYSFVNLYLWGRQKAAFIGENLVFFSHFSRKSVYLFPVGPQDLADCLEQVIQDARQRGIACRFTGMTAADCALLEERHPDQFRIAPDRAGWDYLYSIEDLAQLKGRKFQKKRNHVNRFRADHPQARLEELAPCHLEGVQGLLDSWFQARSAIAPSSELYMEQVALRRALAHHQELDLHGLVLLEGDRVLGLTMGSRLNENTFDIHFEKALEDGGNAILNQGFAQYLQERFPEVLWLNREDDLGLEGLRKAKLSYCPARMGEKFWACLKEDGCEY